ncbi:rRNA maturation RNase YbeY [Alteromonas oceanisediminis]|uniref:rRNA maturation RNase YbeY n=1 Tax=Alteromonas oceanisediminis TaxID=2836180 RepID=UPI001BDB5C7D|nr:rRNA maturation RNase YbeY [Alteromonas oceanisediminis]MBT0588095.1 rRNA maturation RNase YbeY [Alteromonas oceanisediminis]
MTAVVDRQVACENTVPDDATLAIWIDSVLAYAGIDNKEITVRFVSSAESQQLNDQFRGKDKPTNVLSFPFECPPEVNIPLLGDLVICADVVEQEAREQGKPLDHHYAHLTLHGVLHLLGYDHIEEQQAQEMERLETQLLAKLGIDDPYQDH